MLTWRQWKKGKLSPTDKAFLKKVKAGGIDLVRMQGQCVLLCMEIVLVRAVVLVQCWRRTLMWI